MALDYFRASFDEDFMSASQVERALDANKGSVDFDLKRDELFCHSLRIKAVDPGRVSEYRKRKESIFIVLVEKSAVSGRYNMSARLIASGKPPSLYDRNSVTHRAVSSR